MAQKEVIEIEAKLGKAKKEIEALRKDVQRLAKAQETTAKSTNKIAKSLNTLTKGVIIGVALKAFETLVEVFNKNKRVADFLAVAIESLTIMFNDLINFVLNNTQPIVDTFKKIFNDPQQAIKDFAAAIRDYLIESFNSFVETLGFIGDAVEALFIGDFALAGELAKKAGKEMVDVFTGVDGTVDKVVETTKEAVSAITEYTKATVEQAKANVQLAKTAEVSAALNQGLIEQYDRQAEKLRQVIDEERNTLEERIQANNELKDVLDQQEQAMLANANAILASAQAQYSKNDSQENYIALIEAQNEVLAVQAQIEGFRSEQKANDLALSRELAQVDRDRAQTNIDNYRTEREAQIELIENDVARARMQLELEEEVYNRSLELLNARLAAEKEGSVAYAEILNERSTLDAEYNATKTQLNQEASKLESQTAIEGLSLVRDALGENAVAAKGLAVAEATINTYQGATKALAQGGILGTILAAVNIAAGLANVRKIISTPLPQGLGGSGGFSAPSGATVAANTQGVNFNTVAAVQQNRLLGDISNAVGQPTRAFVVASDVTTAQELQRKKISNASF